MGRADYYKRGSWNVICDRCGFKYKAEDLRMEWDGLMVCAEKCWEPRQPQDFLRGIADPIAPPWTRAQGQFTYTASAQTLPLPGVYGSALTLPGVAGSYASTPAVNQLNTPANADMDIIVWAQPNNWASGNGQALSGQWAATGNLQYLFFLSATGQLALAVTTDGTTVTEQVAYSTQTLSGSGNLWVRATLDVNNGAGGNTTTFYTSPDGVTWTEFGNQVVVAGAISIFNSTGIAEIGTSRTGTANPYAGFILQVLLYYGISTAGATPVMNYDPSFALVNSRSFTDNSGLTWQLQGLSSIRDIN
jgi:hypothetical protein